MTSNIYSSKPTNLALTHKPELAGGYYDLETLASIKGYKSLQHFNTHYAIYWAHDENGKKFYNCENRRATND